jgi:hypothetical protein
MKLIVDEKPASRRVDRWVCNGPQNLDRKKAFS